MNKIPSTDDFRAMFDANPDEVTPWEAAFHEAGHVIVGVALGSFPSVAYLNEDAEDPSHAGRTTWRDFIGVVPLNSWPARTDRLLVAAFTARTTEFATVVAAGQVALYIACGLSIEPDDMAVVVEPGVAEDSDGQTLAWLAGRARNPWEWATDCHREAERILRATWDWVQIVAAALMERRRLEEEDLRELLADFRSSPSCTLTWPVHDHAVA